jgi:choline dehydrogenase-like flavoprotein
VTAGVTPDALHDVVVGAGVAGSLIAQRLTAAGRTHVMGDDPGSSVVDVDQRSWEHRSLFLVGSGSFPTMGTSNPTLTMAALAPRTADRLTKELRR